jgi:adenosine deaminase
MNAQMQVASVQADYEYTNKVPHEEDSFGVDLAGRVAVFPQSKFARLVSLMQETFPPART